jgi:hypothetical protein
MKKWFILLIGLVVAVYFTYYSVLRINKTFIRRYSTASETSVITAGDFNPGIYLFADNPTKVAEDDKIRRDRLAAIFWPCMKIELLTRGVYTMILRIIF